MESRTSEERLLDAVSEVRPEDGGSDFIRRSLERYLENADETERAEAERILREIDGAFAEEDE